MLRIHRLESLTVSRVFLNVSVNNTVNIIICSISVFRNFKSSSVILPDFCRAKTQRQKNDLWARRRIFGNGPQFTNCSSQATVTTPGVRMTSVESSLSFQKTTSNYSSVSWTVSSACCFLRPLVPICKDAGGNLKDVGGGINPGSLSSPGRTLLHHMVASQRRRRTSMLELITIVPPQKAQTGFSERFYSESIRFFWAASLGLGNEIWIWSDDHPIRLRTVDWVPHSQWGDSVWTETESSDLVECRGGTRVTLNLRRMRHAPCAGLCGMQLIKLH